MAEHSQLMRAAAQKDIHHVPLANAVAYIEANMDPEKAAEAISLFHAAICPGHAVQRHRAAEEAARVEADPAPEAPPEVSPQAPKVSRKAAPKGDQPKAPKAPKGARKGKKASAEQPAAEQAETEAPQTEASEAGAEGAEDEGAADTAQSEAAAEG